MKVRTLTVMLIVVGLILLAYVAILAGAMIMPLSVQHSLPPCATEDSDNCHWDARTQGNGHGLSFDVIDGVVEYTH